MIDQGTARLCAIGEFDTLNSRLLEASIRQAVADGFSRVLLDFSRVAFMDVSVVHALVRSWDVAAEHGCILRIVDPSEAASLILDASGTRTVLCPDQAAEDRVDGDEARRRTIAGRSSAPADPAVADVLASAELAVAKARETIARSRHIIDSARTPPPEV